MCTLRIKPYTLYKKVVSDRRCQCLFSNTGQHFINTFMIIVDNILPEMC